MLGRSLRGKGCDGLKLLAVVELEILFLQVGHHFAVRVAHHDAHQHVIDANLEGCRSILTGNLFGVLLGTGDGFGGGSGIRSRGSGGWGRRSEERRVGKEGGSWGGWEEVRE